MCVVKLTGGYAASSSLTKVPDVMKRGSSSVASDSAADVSESTDTASRDSLPPLVQDLHADSAPHTAIREDRRKSLETPASVSSASNISLIFERTHASSRGRVRGTTSRTPASHSALRKKH